MNPCIGDRKLEPDEEPEVCEMCGGHGEQCRMTMDGWDCQPCPECCHDADPVEPNDLPEE